MITILDIGEKHNQLLNKYSAKSRIGTPAFLKVNMNYNKNPCRRGYRDRNHSVVLDVEMVTKMGIGTVTKWLRIWTLVQ